MIKFYKKYINVIVGFLFTMFIFKGCQSCQRDNQIEWNKIQYEHIRDSLCNEIVMRDVIIDGLRDSVYIYKLVVKGEKDKVNMLKEVNKNQQENNRALIRTNKKLLNNEKSK